VLGYQLMENERREEKKQEMKRQKELCREK
jgi:hypothetical protein